MSEAVLFGSYELLDRIAEGGMAEVWRARSRGVAGFEKTVVIKRVLPSLMANTGFAELLVREAKIAALLSHPNIVQIFDLGEERGAYFIAMEHVPGKDLGQVMSLGEGAAARGGLSVPLKVWIVSEVAKALDYAHRRRGPDGRPLNIVHRDVSPQNVLLGFEGAVKVADFGIARADQSELGKGDDPKVLRGKYAYMSPEQARGEPLDRRSDLFSLGIVLYELLTSRRLFRGRSSGETLELVRRADVPALPEALGLPPALEIIVRRALARDRDRRYASAGELCTDLGKLLFDLGAQVDEADLADAMVRIFPQDEEQNPNKLNVDLMLRAYDDATALSHPGRELDATPSRDASPGTRAFPSSRRLRAEKRRVVLLGVQRREEDDTPFDTTVRSLGGLPLGAAGAVREAVFGHGTSAERAAEHAARAALELRRRLAVLRPRSSEPPVMAIAPGDATLFEGEALEPDPELSRTVAAAMEGKWPGEIRVDDALVGGLARTFFFTEGNPPVLEGFRSRHEREALSLRKRGPLSGRRVEMRALSSALAEVATAPRRPLLLVGEPGAGKSRLVAELSALAVSQDVVVVRGAGAELEMDRSYGALAVLWEDICGIGEEDGPSERFAKVDRLRVLGLSPRQVRRVGELIGLSYPVPPDRRAGRPRGIELMTAVRAAVRALASDGPVLLVLEDLHFFDDATRQVLPILLRGLRRSRVMTLVTARPGLSIPRLHAEVLSLEPLCAQAAGRLFAFGVGARAVEEDLAARVAHETNGNPALVESMAEAVADDERLHIEAGVASLPSFVDIPIAEAQQAVVAARIHALRPDERDLVRAAAMFERGAAVDTLAELRGVPLDVVEQPLRRLLVSGLIVSDDGDATGVPVDLLFPGRGEWGGGHGNHPLPRRARVPGALLRRAIAGGMTEGEQRRLHGRIVAVLERSSLADPERLDELAQHAAQSSDRRRAPDYLIEAADAAHRAGDPRGAALRLWSAARIANEVNDSGHDAAELLLRASDLALEGADADLAEHVLGEMPDARRAGTATRVRVAIARSRAVARRDRWAEAAKALSELSGVIESIDDPVLRARALLEWGAAEIEAGRPDEAAKILDGAQVAAGDGEPALRGRALCSYAVALARGDRHEDADRAVAAALAVTARLGSGELRHLSLAAMAEARAARGALEDAAARWAEAAEVAAQLGACEEAARLDALAAVTFVEAGEEERAVPIAERAVQVGRKHRVESAQLLGTAAQAALAVSADRDPVWLPKLEDAIARLGARGLHAEAAHALQMLAHAHRVLGDRDAEAGALGRAAETASAGGHRAMAARLGRALA